MGVRLSTTSILTSMLVGMVGSELYGMAYLGHFANYKRSTCRQCRLCLIFQIIIDFALGEISVYKDDIYVLQIIWWEGDGGFIVHYWKWNNYNTITLTLTF